MSLVTSCGICGCELRGSLVRCDRCDTPHHHDCWQYNAGCAVFACNPATKATPIKGKAGLARRVLPGFAVLFLLAGVAVADLALRPTGSPVEAILTPVRVTQMSATGALQHGVGTDVDMTAPDFRIQDIDGKQVRFSELRKGKVTVLTFWLAYCADCMPHVPPWTDIYQRYQESDRLSLVNVAAFTSDSPFIRKFVEAYSIGGRVLLDGTGEAVRTYGVHSITVFVLDETGRIRYVGSQAKAAADEVQKVLVSLGQRPNAK